MTKQNQTTQPVAAQNDVTITAPNFKTAHFKIRGTAPLVINRFSQKATNMMMEAQAAGSLAKKKGKAKEAKDFDALYEGARHISHDGWDGLSAMSVKHAMVGACRAIDFKMTQAKIAFFVEPDGFDRVDGDPLIRITKGTPNRVDHHVRNASGVADIRPRPMWAAGWEATVRVKFDADLLTISDIANLLMRAGLQNGIHEGRPASKMSVGMGWGTFEVCGD